MDRFTLLDEELDAPVLCGDCDEPMEFDGEIWKCNNAMCERNWE
jgi:hypothetical protein